MADTAAVNYSRIHGFQTYDVGGKNWSDPDDWDLAGRAGCQQAQLGDAVPPPVAFAFGKEILRVFKKEDNR